MTGPPPRNPYPAQHQFQPDKMVHLKAKGKTLDYPGPGGQVVDKLKHGHLDPGKHLAMDDSGQYGEKSMAVLRHDNVTGESGIQNMQRKVENDMRARERQGHIAGGGRRPNGPTIDLGNVGDNDGPKIDPKDPYGHLSNDEADRDPVDHYTPRERARAIDESKRDGPMRDPRGDPSPDSPFGTPSDELLGIDPQTGQKLPRNHHDPRSPGQAGPFDAHFTNPDAHKHKGPYDHNGRVLPSSVDWQPGHLHDGTFYELHHDGTWRSKDGHELPGDPSDPRSVSDKLKGRPDGGPSKHGTPAPPGGREPSPGWPKLPYDPKDPFKDAPPEDSEHYDYWLQEMAHQHGIDHGPPPGDGKTHGVDPRDQGKLDELIRRDDLERGKRDYVDEHHSQKYDDNEYRDRKPQPTLPDNPDYKRPIYDSKGNVFYHHEDGSYRDDKGRVHDHDNPPPGHNDTRVIGPRPPSNPPPTMRQPGLLGPPPTKRQPKPPTSTQHPAPPKIPPLPPDKPPPKMPPIPPYTPPKKPPPLVAARRTGLSTYRSQVP